MTTPKKKNNRTPKKTARPPKKGLHPPEKENPHARKKATPPSKKVAPTKTGQHAVATAKTARSKKVSRAKAAPAKPATAQTSQPTSPTKAPRATAKPSRSSTAKTGHNPTTNIKPARTSAPAKAARATVKPSRTSASAKAPIARPAKPAREKLAVLRPSGQKDDSFFDLVHEVARQIPRGRVTSYGAIAACLGTRLSARMVGWAMLSAHTAHKAVPAHRVVNRNGLLSGRHHYNPPERMQQLLEQEGIVVKDDQVVNFKKLFWNPATEL